MNTIPPPSNPAPADSAVDRMTSIADIDAATMVNLSRYPIADLNQPDSKTFADQCRAEYLETGLCMLQNFILPEALNALAVEAGGLSEHAYFCKSSHNAYLDHGDDNATADDASNRQEQTFVGSVPYDNIPDACGLRQLYLWDPLKDFIGYVLGKSPFYRFADPLGACSINVFVEGGEHGWHFDESEFTVTLMLQAPSVGGAFEYAPKIRGLKNEKDLVSGILDGKRDNVVELPFSAGTLLIFGGNQTLHRVTQVSGTRPRLVPVLCYAEDPTLVNSETVRQLFWGRTGSENAT